MKHIFTVSGIVAACLIAGCHQGASQPSNGANTASAKPSFDRVPTCDEFYTPAGKAIQEAAWKECQTIPTLDQKMKSPACGIADKYAHCPPKSFN